MNCIENFEEPLLLDEYTKLRKHILENAVRKLALQGPQVDLMDEAIAYREIMRRIMDNELPRGKEGPEHLALFLETGLDAHYIPHLIKDKESMHFQEGAKDIVARWPCHEYPDDFNAYIDKMRRWFHAHGVAHVILGTPEEAPPAPKPEPQQS